MKLLPVALDVAGKRCLVVGAGIIAARKLEALLECDAQVHLVAPELCDYAAALCSRVEYSPRHFEDDDCRGCVLVFACTNDRVLNAHVAAVALQQGAWCNVVDDAQQSDFHLAAAVRRGSICIGITTGGGAPVLAKHLKRQVEDCIGDEYAALSELMSAHRETVKSMLPTQTERAAFWNELLESEILALLREGKREEARAMMTARVMEASR